MKSVNVIQEHKLEEVFGSLDGVKRATAPPFLYGKIRGKLCAPKESFFDRKKYFIARPAITISVVSFIVLIDVMAFESASKHIPDKFENTDYVIGTKDEFDEMIFYNVPDNEYVSFF